MQVEGRRGADEAPSGKMINGRTGKPGSDRSPSDSRIRDAIAHLQIGDAGSQLDDHAGRLVTCDERRRQAEHAMSCVHIGVTHTPRCATQ
jgi:hypothetical protein